MWLDERFSQDASFFAMAICAKDTPQIFVNASVCAEMAEPNHPVWRTAIDSFTWFWLQHVSCYCNYV